MFDAATSAMLRGNRMSVFVLAMFTGLKAASGSDGFLKVHSETSDIGINAEGDAVQLWNESGASIRESTVEMPGSSEEELLVVRSPPRSISSAITTVRNFMYICALVSFLIAFLHMVKLPRQSEGKQPSVSSPRNAANSVPAIFTESLMCRALVLFVHGVLVMDVAMHRPEILNMQSGWVYCKWLLFLGTLGLYLAASLSDPGWAPQAKPEEQDSSDSAQASANSTQCGQELRWCKICRIYQPLRTKHCADCNRCVRTHDHHCPWLGNCVGENNRVLFFWFLLFQVVELAVFFCEGLQGIDVFQPSISLTLGLLTIAVFFFMLVCLLGFHSFLIWSDITTWEYLSWQRITYLQDLDQHCGSPFEQSVPARVASYCCGPHWCPAPLKRLAKLQYDGDGAIIWEFGEQQLSCCLRACMGSCGCLTHGARP